MKGCPLLKTVNDNLTVMHFFCEGLVAVYSHKRNSLKSDRQFIKYLASSIIFFVAALAAACRHVHILLTDFHHTIFVGKRLKRAR